MQFSSIFSSMARLALRGAFLALCATLPAAEPELSHDPAAELASFQIADGFEVKLFASEADGLIKPIQMRFDARGRLWVIGSTVYPMLKPGEKPNDKVLILEDSDGDGHVDSVKTFADGLMIPTGLELVRNSSSSGLNAPIDAYVGHGTELLRLRDNDGDDRADERTVVFRGFGTGDNHQNINSFTWSPSGELWMCQGLHIFSRVETPYGLVELNKAGIWRLRPRIEKLEGFYGSEFEPQNPWGHVFDEWNQHIVLAGNNSSPIFPDPGLVPDRRDEPPPLLWPTGNGRKVSGGDFVANAHWPAEWQGRLILGGYINNSVWSINVVDDGAGFRFEDGPPLIRSTRREFRPVDVKFGPDGALYLCDWYNPIIGHYQASFRHPDRDKTHGRIWRVTAKGRPLNKRPEIHNASVEALLAQVDSKDRWTRQFTLRDLTQRRTEDVIPALTKWANNSARTERELMAAAAIFQAHELPHGPILERLSHAHDPRARAYAGYLLAFAAPNLKNKTGILKQLATDENPRVRLEAIVAASYLNFPGYTEPIDVLAIATEHPFDRFLTYAFNQAVHTLKANWRPLITSMNPQAIAAFVRADGTTDSLDALRATLKNPRPDLLAILAEVGGPDDLRNILQLPARDLTPEILKRMEQRNIKPSADPAPLLTPLLATDLRDDATQLAGLWKTEPLFPQLRETARDPKNPSHVAAIQGISRIGPSVVPFLRELTDSTDAATKIAAIAGWQFYEPDTAAKAATDFLEHADKSATEKLISEFLKRPASAKALASAAANKQFPADVSNAALTAIAASGRRYDDLTKAFSNPASTASASLSPGERAGVRGRFADLATFTKEVRDHGDATAGKTIFNRAELACATCHKVNGAGGNIGPDLSALGTAQPIDFIIGAILEPQKEIKEGFTSVSITTKTGDEFQGYITRESADEIVLRDPLPNADVKIRRADIAAGRNNGSLMPNGLADQLTNEEFRDLVKYLSTLGKP